MGTLITLLVGAALGYLACKYQPQLLTKFHDLFRF
jgi:hypothetical protein